MTKTQVIRQMAEQMDVSPKQMVAFFDLLFATAMTQTRKAGEFTIPGLGKLVKAQRAARMGRNPATGESPSFHPGSSQVGTGERRGAAWRFRLQRGSAVVILHARLQPVSPKTCRPPRRTHLRSILGGFMGYAKRKPEFPTYIVVVSALTGLLEAASHLLHWASVVIDKLHK